MDLNDKRTAIARKLKQTDLLDTLLAVRNRTRRGRDRAQWAWSRARNRHRLTKEPVGVCLGLMRWGRLVILGQRAESPISVDQARSHTRSIVISALRDAEVAYFELPSQPEHRPRLAVADSDRSVATAALRESLPAHTYVQASPEACGPYGAPLPLSARSCSAELDAASRICCFTFIGAGDHAAIGEDGGCEIEFWTASNSGRRLTPLYVNRSTPELRINESGRLVRPSDSYPTRPHIADVTFPVDVVFTWVDGDDPEWSSRRDETLRSLGHRVSPGAVSRSRFANRDELRFSLRSLEMHAPFVNHIYLVTAGQRPSWLVKDHPRLTVVSHEEIIDPQNLPTFNSHAIESRLHHIPGLSEHYIYMNDDFLFGRSVSAELFFSSNGLARFFQSEALIPLGRPDATNRGVDTAAMNGRALIEERWGVTVTQKFKHAPYPQLRSVHLDVDEWFPEEVRRTTSSRIRSPGDLAMASSFHHYVAYLTARAHPGFIHTAYADLAEPRLESKLYTFARELKFDTLCVNDTSDDDRSDQRSSVLLAEFFNQRFPVPSSFEQGSDALPSTEKGTLHATSRPPA